MYDDYTFFMQFILYVCGFAVFVVLLMSYIEWRKEPDEHEDSWRDR